MTGDAIERCFLLCVAIDAKAHVDFIHRHNAIHRLNQAVTTLAFDTGMDMRLMREAHEIGQRIHSIPFNLERRASVIGPGTSHGLNSSAGNSTAVASDASRDCRDARFGRTAGIGMTVLAWNFVHARMDAVAERNRLDDIGARQPWTFGYADCREPQDEQQECERQHYAVHVHDETGPE